MFAGSEHDRRTVAPDGHQPSASRLRTSSSSHKVLAALNANPVIAQKEKELDALGQTHSDEHSALMIGAGAGSVLKDQPFTMPLIWAMLNAMLGLSQRPAMQIPFALSHLPLWLGVACYAGAFQFGYNSGVINVPQLVICSDLQLSTIEWALAVAVFCVGGLCGSYMGGAAADKIGRSTLSLSLSAFGFAKLACSDIHCKTDRGRGQRRRDESGVCK
jgi:hypothetical protein